MFQELNLSWCNEVTDVGISRLSKGCEMLQKLYVYGCNQVSDAVDGMFAIDVVTR